MQSASPLAALVDFIKLVKSRPLVWGIPMLACIGLALFYAVFKAKEWEAVQALTIRSDSITQTDAPGKFKDADEMKTVQQTVLELAHAPSVLRATLAAVSQAEPGEPKPEPTQQQIERLRDAVKLVTPKGTEFGESEILYAKVKHRDRKKAAELATALCSEIQNHLQQMRHLRAEGLVEELERTVQIAEETRDTAIARLGHVEAGTGADLVELRSLHESANGDSDLRRKLVEIENELRQADKGREELLQLKSELVRVDADERVLMAMPSSLLDKQPALRQLKEGLIAAQLKTATMLGSMQEDHPQVQAAKLAELAAAQKVRLEISTAIHGLDVDLLMTERRQRALAERVRQTKTRLAQVAELRAKYSGLIADVSHHTTLLESARRRLAEAQSTRVSSEMSGLITLIDQPTIGSSPLGPSRALIVIAGAIGGFMAGLGCLLAITPSDKFPGSQTSAGQPRGKAVPASKDPVHTNRNGMPVSARSSLADILKSLTQGTG